MASPNSLIAVTVWLFYFSKVVLGNEECVAFGPKTCIEKYSSSKWRMDCKIHISCDNINIPPGNHQFLSESLNNAFITAETTGSNDYDISVRNTAVWHHILANETIESWPINAMTSVEFLRCGIIDVESMPIDHSMVDKIGTLSLAENAIFSLPRRIFHNYTKLAYLNLAANQFSNTSALPDLSKNEDLIRINLSRNKLLDVDSSLFHEIQNVPSVDLTRNIILSLSNFDNVTTKIEYINLEDNQLKTVDVDMLNMTFPKLKSIGLAGNPLHCSCELTRLKDLLNSTEQIFDEPVCKTPTYLEGVSIFEADLCNSETASVPTVISIVIGVAVLLGLTFLAVGLAYLYRHGRILFVKRSRRQAEAYVYDGPGLDTFEMHDDTNDARNNEL